MKCYYLDASALVQRYVHERGSGWIRATIGSGEETLLFTFLSADNDLNEAARAEDLSVDNPNRH